MNQNLDNLPPDIAAKIAARSKMKDFFKRVRRRIYLKRIYGKKREENAY